MSTDETPVPRTRAELRAAREAAEAVAPKVETDAGTDAAAFPPIAEPVDEREAAMRAAMVEAAEAANAATVAAANPEPRPATVYARARPQSEDSAEDSATDSADNSADDTKAASPAPEPERSARRNQGTRKSDRPQRGYFTAIAAVLGVLIIVAGGLGFASLTQGPRITKVQVDPKQAIDASGSRVILTANQALSKIDASQVKVEPAVPFTVDASGRGIGIRFTVPLDDSTKYSITVSGVKSTGGGPSATLHTNFSTPASTMFLLRRDVSGKDTIFRTDLSGQNAVAVYSADKIDDFRATSTKLVVAVEEKDLSALYVMDLDGKHSRALTLPGTGFIGSIQVSERGGLVGYTFSDKDITATSGRASVLVTQSLAGTDKPQIAQVAGVETSILVWQFVPDSAAMLFIDFNGALSLIDRSTDSGVKSLGLAANIQGISRGTYTAVVERVDGSVVELNLADGTEQPLAASNPDYGSAISIVPFPGGTVRHVVSVDETGYPNGQAIIRVDDNGAATSVVQVGATDSILQACASPSGQYVAVAVAPDLPNNAYDGMLLPLPEKVETHLIDLRTSKEIVALTGFDSSWCATAPHY